MVDRGNGGPREWRAGTLPDSVCKPVSRIRAPHNMDEVWLSLLSRAPCIILRAQIDTSALDGVSIISVHGHEALLLFKLYFFLLQFYALPSFLVRHVHVLQFPVLQFPVL